MTIWFNKTTGGVAPLSAMSRDRAEAQGFISFSSPYEARFLAGEKPESWDNPVLPDRRKLYKLARKTEVWFHASKYAPLNTQGLLASLTASSTLDEEDILEDIFNFFYGIIVELASNSMPFTEDMKTEIDAWLAASYFDWTVADVEALL